MNEVSFKKACELASTCVESGLVVGGANNAFPSYFRDGGCGCCSEFAYCTEQLTIEQRKVIANIVIAAWCKWAGVEL